MPDRTLVSVIAAKCQEIPGSIAQRHKQTGTWQDITYGELLARAEEIAAGLVDLGMQVGDRIALLSNNSVEWGHCDLGILFAGGVTVAIYPTSIQREVAYILENSESRLIFVEDANQLEKAVQARQANPRVEKAVVMNGPVPAGDFALSLATLREKGRALLARDREALGRIEARLRPEDLATIIYTSGTTGPPKGVMLTHKNILFVIDAVLDTTPDTTDFKLTLSFLPLSHSLERVGGHFLPLTTGRTIAYAESLDKLGDNFREVRPDIAIAVPRVFEKIYSRINETLREMPERRRKIFRWAVGVGREAIRYRQKNQPLPFGLALRHRLADRLVFRKLRAVLGGRMKYFVSGGAPLDANIAEFFSAVGIIVLEGWGATETAAPATVNRLDNFVFGSVGLPLPGVEVKVAEDGELLVRGAGVCTGYWKMPAQSAETFDAEGWYHTGDVGRIAGDGFVYITDRKKELIITSAGKNISPQNIENKLKLSPFVSNVMTIGDRRNYVTALVTLDAEAVNKQLGTGGLDHAALAARADVRQLIQAEIDRVNADLPRYETIKKFRIPPADFTVEMDDLSPTLKLKRRNITARHQALIDEMYE
ncbi:MAG: long-chain fatty acid--CoA ligase [Myxococcales bacterium]|nr:long-chain fatty acid--CoA ligase [Myxococcales bacterium]